IEINLDLGLLEAQARIVRNGLPGNERVLLRVVGDRERQVPPEMSAHLDELERRLNSGDRRARLFETQLFPNEWRTEREAEFILDGGANQRRVLELNTGAHLARGKQTCETGLGDVLLR